MNSEKWEVYSLEDAETLECFFKFQDYFPFLYWVSIGFIFISLFLTVYIIMR